MHKIQDDYINASNLFTEALTISKDFGDATGKALALRSLGEISMLRRDYSHAIAFYSEALETISDKEGRVKALLDLAEAHRAEGRIEGRAGALLAHAELHYLQEEYTKAATLYSEVIEIYTDTGDEHKRAKSLYRLAKLQQLQGEYCEAVLFYSEAIKAYFNKGDSKGRVAALRGLAEVHRAQGNRQGRADALSALAQTHHLQKEYGRAISYYSEALGVFSDGQERDRALLGMAEAQQLQKDSSKGTRLYS